MLVVVKTEAFVEVTFQTIRPPGGGRGGRVEGNVLVPYIGEPAYAGGSEAASAAASWCWLSWGSIAAIKNLAVALMVSRDCLS